MILPDDLRDLFLQWSFYLPLPDSIYAIYGDLLVYRHYIKFVLCRHVLFCHISTLLHCVI